MKIIAHFYTINYNSESTIKKEDALDSQSLKAFQMEIIKIPEDDKTSKSNKADSLKEVNHYDKITGNLSGIANDTSVIDIDTALKKAKEDME